MVLNVQVAGNRAVGDRMLLGM